MHPRIHKPFTQLLNPTTLFPRHYSKNNSFLLFVRDPKAFHFTKYQNQILIQMGLHPERREELITGYNNYIKDKQARTFKELKNLNLELIEFCGKPIAYYILQTSFRLAEAQLEFNRQSAEFLQKIAEKPYQTVLPRLGN